jgi:hypothetical protein
MTVCALTSAVTADENELIEEMLAAPIAAKFIPAEYGLTA